MSLIKKIKNILVVIAGFNSYLYGNIEIVRLYTRLSRLIPINVRIQHGWYHQLHKDDLISDRPLMLVWSKRIADLWKENSKKPVEILGSPFVIYRHIKNINQKQYAAGTVAFPHHSTKAYENIYEIDDYCETLKRLPAEYKPITICLYYMDIATHGPIFKKHGFNITTAGKPQICGFRFVNRFYKILSEHRFCTSNTIGSYTFYAVEMDIPFFITGAEGTVKLKPGQKKFPKNTIFKNSDFFEEIKLIFSKISKTISEEQRKLVLDEVGINDSITPEILRQKIAENLTLEKIIGKIESVK